MEIWEICNMHHWLRRDGRPWSLKTINYQLDPMAELKFKQSSKEFSKKVIDRMVEKGSRDS